MADTPEQLCPVSPEHHQEYAGGALALTGICLSSSAMVFQW